MITIYDQSNHLRNSDCKAWFVFETFIACIMVDWWFPSSSILVARGGQQIKAQKGIPTTLDTVVSRNNGRKMGCVSCGSCPIDSGAFDLGL